MALSVGMMHQLAACWIGHVRQMCRNAHPLWYWWMLSAALGAVCGGAIGAKLSAAFKDA